MTLTMIRILSLCFAMAVATFGANQPNPPEWPSSVKVFGPADSVGKVESIVNAAYATNGGQSPEDNGQFSSERFTFFFKPGSYSVEVPVGYYTQVAGLGELPTDVVFTSPKGVYCQEGSLTVTPGALNTFWRTAENFQTDAKFAWNEDGTNGMIWAASQASSLRRVVVTNDLSLSQYVQGEGRAGFSSGGFLGNSRVGGKVKSGSQQQFLTRNSKVGAWADGVWNINFVGTEGAPASHCGANESLCSHPYVTVDKTPLIAEKPFITIDGSGKYTLNVPTASSDRIGVDETSSKKIGFEQVYVATADHDTAQTINAQLKKGLHVVLAPGIYSLTAALELNTPDQVLLGLGFATLVAENGTPAIKVGNVDGVRVAGVLLEAGATMSEVLLDWGLSGSRYAGRATNPGVMTDVAMRVGGPSKPSPAQVKVMLRISSGHVVVDNAWLWRADHVQGGGLVRNGANPCDVGAVIDGDDVFAYGLKSEHSLTDLLQWNGERGRTFFYQSEMPYDVTQANYGDKGYVGYRVAADVSDHLAYGVGVYHYFRDYAVTVKTAIAVPRDLESSFVAPSAVFLNGLGVIQHIINNQGSRTAKDPAHPTKAVPEWFCPVPSSSAGLLDGVCKVGDPVTCPGHVPTVGCAGNACCPDGSTCPSAAEDFGCCPKPKESDCLKRTANHSRFSEVVV